jgi:hypothetical protein
MSDRKRAIYECVERMGFFGEANPQLATELPITTELFPANQTNKERLTAAGITRESSTGAGKSQTRSKVARASEIDGDVRRVGRTARLIEKKVPDFQNTFEVPRGAMSYLELTEKAEAFIRDAAPSKNHFGKYGLTDAFFTRLQTNVAAFREITQGQQDAKRTGVGATADTEAILEDSLDVRAELKIAIENHYKDNPAKLAEWLTACHIRRRGEAEPEPPDTEEPPEEEEPPTT